MLVALPKPGRGQGLPSGSLKLSEFHIEIPTVFGFERQDCSTISAVRSFDEKHGHLRGPDSTEIILVSTAMLGLGKVFHAAKALQLTHKVVDGSLILTIGPRTVAILSGVALVTVTLS